MITNSAHQRHQIPPIVHIVLIQAARCLEEGSISTETFAAQIDRIIHEELEPHGYNLLVRDLPDGRKRFLIKAIKCGTVCGMWEHSPERASEIPALQPEAISA